MEWFKRRWLRIVLGTTLTLLSMRVGLSLLRQVAGHRGESEEYLWLVSNSDALGLPMQQSKAFTGYLKGYSGGPSPQSEEFRRTLKEEDAEETFTQLARRGPEGARLYGLCGLRALRSVRLPDYLSLANTDERRVALINGCSIYVPRVREAVQNPGFWAICDEMSGAGLPNKALQRTIALPRFARAGDRR